MRLVVRAAVRAALPLAYTRGFNPHPILSLPAPRPVAVASRGELVVLALNEPLAPDQIVERINAHVPRGMTFTGARPLARGEKPHPRRIRYDWPIPQEQRDRLREKVAAFVAAASWTIERRPNPKRRGQTTPPKTLDLKPLVETLAVRGPGLSWTLVPSGDLWARPAEVLDALGLDGPVDLASAVRTEVNYTLSDTDSMNP